MTLQRIHEKLGPMDLLTKQEMSDVFGHHIDRFLRDKYRTIKLMKLPQLRGVAAGATLNLAQGNQPGDYGVPCGPEQGFIWMLRRVIVASNVTTDTARYQLYSGSDPANYDYNHLLEGFAQAVPAPVPSQPAVPASTVAQQNVNLYPVQVVISGGTVTAVFVNGIQVGSGDGTYTVPSGGAISVTYSVAPTWVWSNLNTATPAGEPVGLGYYPSSEATWLWPGEQVYAQVLGATANNSYVLSGIAIEVAAEMVGKLVGP